MLDSFNGGPPRLKIIKGTVWNRTGRTLLPGEIVAFNNDGQTTYTDAASVSSTACLGVNQSDSTDGAAGYIWGSVIPPTTANVRGEMCAVDDTADGQGIPDNAQFTAVFEHPDFPIYLEPSSGIAKLELFRGTNGQYYGTGMTTAEIGAISTAGAASVYRMVGQALEAGPSGASAARKRCRFWGGQPPVVGLVTGVGAS